MSVRAKFYCAWVKEIPAGNREVQLHPVYPGSDASQEDKAFWQATPNGSLNMHINNPPASDLFVPGDHYYLTFEPVPEA